MKPDCKKFGIRASEIVEKIYEYHKSIQPNGYKMSEETRITGSLLSICKRLEDETGTRKKLPNVYGFVETYGLEDVRPDLNN